MCGWARAAPLNSLSVDVVVAAARLTRFAARYADVTEPTAVWRALSIIDEHGPVRVTTFADIDRCTQPTATAMISRLATDGSVTKAADPADHRAALVSLTDAGRRRLTALRTSVARSLDPLLDELSEDDRSHLRATTVIIHRLMYQYEPTRATRGDVDPDGSQTTTGDRAE